MLMFTVQALCNMGFLLSLSPAQFYALLMPILSSLQHGHPVHPNILPYSLAQFHACAGLVQHGRPRHPAYAAEPKLPQVTANNP